MVKSGAKYKFLLIGLAISGVVAFACAFFLGSSGFSVAEFLELASGKASAITQNIFINIRLPRAVGAFAVGAALAVSGCCLQGVFKNPMADPFVLGMSSGAALGATIAMTFIQSSSVFGASTVAVFSFVFAMAAMLIVYNISKIRGKVSTFSLLLSGFSMSAMLTSVIYLIMLLNRDKMESVIMWNMGSLTNMTWEKLYIALPVIIVCSTMLISFAKPLNIMLNGDEVSQSMGIDTHKIRRNMLIFTSLLAATAVSVSGIIGFVGLMIPHLLRLVIGPDNRKLMPLCLVGGGVYLLICDTIARMVLKGQELPVGVITALFGVPFFIFLLRRGRKAGV